MKDGYQSLLVQPEGGEAEEVVSEENGILISMMLRQYFLSLKVLRRWKKVNPALKQHWKEVQENLQPHCPLLEPKVTVQRQARKQSTVSGHNDANDSTDTEKMMPSPPRQKKQHRKANSTDSKRTKISHPSLKDDFVDPTSDSGSGSDEDEDEYEYRNEAGDADNGTATAVAAAKSGTRASTIAGFLHAKPFSTALEQHEHELSIIRRVMRKWRRLSGLKGAPGTCDDMGEGEFTANWTRVSAEYTVDYLAFMSGKGNSRLIADLFFK